MKTLGKLELISDKKDADQICERIRTDFNLEPVVFERPGQKTALIGVFVDSLAQAHALCRKIPANWPVRSVRPSACREEQWATFWRHHFQIQDVGRRFRTVPAWENAPDRKRINLRIDPGLSFGTGNHFTTRFCLEALEQAWSEFKPRSMLDAGTGSGILAIAGVKLGIGRVAAFDNDPICVSLAAGNAVLNGLGKNRIRFFAADVLQNRWLNRPADIVCANILTGILIQAAPALWRATGKRLILTGIRESEGNSVAEAFGRSGAQEVARDGDGEWCGLVLARRRTVPGRPPAKPARKQKGCSGPSNPIECHPLISG